MKKAYRYLLPIFTGILLFILLSPIGIALADQADPDNTPIAVVDVYRNLLVSGDRLYLIYANIPYAAQPDALVTEAFIWRLYDTDNTTVLGQTLGTAYNAGGYGYNVYSIYLPATWAPAWESPLLLRLSGNPLIFDSPPVYNFTLTAADYNAENITTEVQAALTTRILAIATDLNIRWGGTTELLYETETGTVLSLTGEEFFRAAIYGLQAMAPDLFRFSAGTITAEERTWTTDYVDNITGQWTGTFVEDGQTAGKGMFNKDYDLLSIILLLAGLGGLFVGNIMISKNVYSALIDVTLVALIFGRLGIPDVLLSFLGLIAALSWVYISAKIWGVLR